VAVAEGIAVVSLPGQPRGWHPKPSRRKMSQVLKAEHPSFVIDADSSRAGVFKDYARLGGEHILMGWDHLLFVLALVLLVGWGARSYGPSPPSPPAIASPWR